ncbi:MAG: hypothetical protein KJ052_01345, partial [Candidatus Hydrogenedentes bacterium]|nr:hypothetical protein [Candidatus Hydrogenedentota bacterium]
PGPDEFEFPKLEAFLRDQLTKEQSRRIKRSNVAGLLTKTLGTLDERIAGRSSELEALGEKLDALDLAMTQDACAVLSRRLFAEPHLWTYALGREVSVRAKGIVGTVYRLLEAARTLPARMVGWLPRFGRGGAGRQAAELLSHADAISDDLDLGTLDIRRKFNVRHSEVALAFARADFDPISEEADFRAFQEGLERTVSAVLRGPARDRLMARARAITSWPATILADLVPLTFLLWSAYIIVRDYFGGILLGVEYFVHAGTVFLILAAAELVVLSLLVRVFAWTTRRRAAVDLRTALGTRYAAFSEARKALDAVRETIGQVQALRAQPRE